MTPPLFACASPASPPTVLVIAELGVNHDGRVDRALALVAAAAAAGADAIKLQCFHPDRLLSNQAMLARYQNAADNAHDLLTHLTLTPDDMRMVCTAAREAGLKCLVTPFSLEDVEDARGLKVDAVKIASPDAVNTPLLRAAARLNVPLLISTGTCDLKELEPAASRLHAHGAGGCLLQCVSSYPVPCGYASLGGMAALADTFDVPVGYSDHTTDPLTGALAVAAGAVVIEKHLTYDTAASGPDHAASLDPPAFADYVRLVRQAAAMLGPRVKQMLPIEADVRTVSRQSLCAARDLPAGHRLGPSDVTIKRPGTGIPAAELDTTMGRLLARPIRANDLLRVDDLV